MVGLQGFGGWNHRILKCKYVSTVYIHKQNHEKIKVHDV